VATDDVKLGRAIYRLARAIEVLNEPDIDSEADFEAVKRELAEARRHLASVDRGKLAATELPEEKEDVA